MALQRLRLREITEGTLPSHLASCYLESQQKRPPVPGSNIVIAHPGDELDCSQLLREVHEDYIPRVYCFNLIAEERGITKTGAQNLFAGRPSREKDNRYQVGWPDRFLQEYEELRRLGYGWDGGDEVPPSEVIFSEALRIVNDVSVCCGILGKAPIFPEMAPGFRGELGLTYFKTNKELCIEVSSAPQEPTVIIVAVSKDKHGAIAKMTPYDRAELFSVISWFVEDEDI
jgi:hypothetical protein